MKKNVFGLKGSGAALRIDSFFAELLLIIPVFAAACCAALSLLSAAAKRAENEEIKAEAIACVQSWCELYSISGSAEQCAAEVFGTDISGGEDEFYSDKGFSVDVTESCEEMLSGSLAYGQLFISEITVSWDGGEITESAVKYLPYPEVTDSGEEVQP